MIQFDTSVIICTYNSPQDKINATIESVLVQKDCAFEIIISDDGSSFFDRNYLENIFKEKKFNNYQILESHKNNGTVKNFYNAIIKASGKYVKLICPGDLLYEEKTLSKYFDFCENNNSVVCFGKAVTYKMINSDFKKVDFKAPLSSDCYHNKKITMEKINTFVFRDFIIGACFYARREELIHYLEKIVDKIIFDEGMVYLLMLSDDIGIQYIDDFVVWYEFGEGISTDLSKISNQEKLKKDVETAFKICSERKEKTIPRIGCKMWFSNRLLYFVVRVITAIRRRLVMVLAKDYNNNELLNYDMINKILLKRGSQ